ncbi:hypothetical protein ACFPTY_20095 [Halomonas beimenensis]|uniref:hypothetical protein n=1 Tax=Halomonas beimenensis TaxID=475662 RepID=UPI00361A171E
MRIALLEDEHEQAQNVQNILDERGHHCDSFPTGQSFLSAVLHRSYDLLIPGLADPRHDGYRCAGKCSGATELADSGHLSDPA